jgi:hypothetical protein
MSLGRFPPDRGSGPLAPGGFEARPFLLQRLAPGGRATISISGHAFPPWINWAHSLISSASWAMRSPTSSPFHEPPAGEIGQLDDLFPVRVRSSAREHDAAPTIPRRKE